MKLTIPDAEVIAVTGHAEKNGEVRVPGGKSLTFEASVSPRVLREFDTKLPEMFYEDDIPRVDGLGSIEWVPEYEKAIFQIGLASEDRKNDLLFTSADVKKVSFVVRPGFLVDLKFTVKVNANKKQHGELDYMHGQKVSVSLKKATQRRIDEKEDDAGETDKAAKAGKQGDLPEIQPLLSKDDLAKGRDKVRH